MSVKLTEKKFCEIYTSFHGDGIDKVNQLGYHRFTGEELYEFVAFCIKIQIDTLLHQSVKQR